MNLAKSGTYTDFGPFATQLGELAQALLAHISEGGDVEAHSLDALASAVLASPEVRLAQAVLDAQGAFKLARAIDLAGALQEYARPSEAVVPTDCEHGQ